jgi:hypothetical protein
LNKLRVLFEGFCGFGRLDVLTCSQFLKFVRQSNLKAFTQMGAVDFEGLFRNACSANRDKIDCMQFIDILVAVALRACPDVPPKDALSRLHAHIQKYTAR